jgi:hypothetical protein
MVSRGSVLQNVFGNLASKLADDFHYVSADVALTDSLTWLPATVPAPTTGLVTLATFSPMHKAVGTTFSGRSADSKARLTAYGIFWDMFTIGDDSQNGIVTAAEDADIGLVATACSANFFSGGGTSAMFYQQATIKVNDDLLKRIRRGIIS